MEIYFLLIYKTYSFREVDSKGVFRVEDLDENRKHETGKRKVKLTQISSKAMRNTGIYLIPFLRLNYYFMTADVLGIYLSLVYPFLVL